MCLADVLLVTDEELHQLRPSGYPSHELRLKRLMPVVILRNININCGLANGARAQVISWTQTAVTVRLMGCVCICFNS